MTTNPDPPMTTVPLFYGGCGVEHCTDCRPLFDADNHPIPGTDTDGPIAKALLAWEASQ